MSKAPKVKPGDWVTVSNRVNAVVTHVYETKGEQVAGWVEAVYLDDRDRAINEDLIWADDHWEFKIKGPTGGYADRYDRLRGFVAQLRSGRSTRH